MIENEDALKSVYDRVMNRTSDDDWERVFDEIQAEKRQRKQEKLDDFMEEYFGVR